MLRPLSRIVRQPSLSDTGALTVWLVLAVLVLIAGEILAETPTNPHHDHHSNGTRIAESNARPPSTVVVADSVPITRLAADAGSQDQVATSTHPIRSGPAWLAYVAAQRSPISDLLRVDLKADGLLLPRNSERAAKVLELRTRAQQFRIARQSQIAASQALEVHYGLATVERLEIIQDEIAESLELLRREQERAEKYGLPIRDPEAILRQSQVQFDQKIQLDAQRYQLRSQLALLVGPEIACNYFPESAEVPVCPATRLDHCALISQAYQQRCDLLGLIYLRNNLTVETIDVARWMSDVVTTSAPFTYAAGSKSFLAMLLPCRKDKNDEELSQRLCMLDKAIAALKERIASEVAIAVDKQFAAAARYCTANELAELWAQRILQLQKYGDQVQSTLIEQQQAQSQWFETRADAMRHQGDWNLANVELGLAIGIIP